MHLISGFNRRSTAGRYSAVEYFCSIPRTGKRRLSLYNSQFKRSDKIYAGRRAYNETALYPNAGKSTKRRGGREPHHLDMLAADSLESTPVLVATLHSMLAPMCIHLHDLGLRVVYVMTDGAALPISFSQNVDWLKRQGILAAAVTCGHAFGGDLEAVNIYSGLLAARKVAGADVIIVSMGPGIVGTGTRWGFTGIEQGEILNAADTLGGKPVVVPRISFADPRPRHRGISHHTLTVLSRVCRTKAVLPLPELEENKMSMVLGQLLNDRLFERYDVCLENTPELLKRLETCGLRITTMGRNVEEEKEFFLSLGAAAQAAYRLFKGENLRKINLA